MPENVNRPPLKVKPEPINNTQRLADFRAIGGGIIHLRPRFKDSRGLTIAYVVKGTRMEVATAVTHRHDDFTKKIGTKTAIEHYLAGKHVTLPLPVKNGVTAELKYLFGQFAG